ncbi:sulfatase-like hydrolase/transferase [Vibrio sp. ZSDE26]|uniref:Sulfatase-like hydrolase/transferase n=1 Tax=Vibrio amylolyticus TaxID=2847292 RepID=A0A9X1XF43_9VIBR|nr:sulfatase-like hydrolase/transferase [Vibrio amylolyticus]MCK6261764.1 sulfatase-like hydrolase/transferase [Vibrio amylolyticus]
MFKRILLASALTASCNVMAAEKPNIVYLLVDNWGWGDLSIQGSTIQTPNIDDFAQEGLRLTNFNVQNQCTPTRSALHTGRLPIRTGNQKVPAPGEPDGLAKWEYTLPELLSDAGYSTALFGKWHVGASIEKLPNYQGYDYFWGTNEGTNAASYTSTPQWDPEVAETPYIWEGVKGKPAEKVKLFDIPAKVTLDREITERTIAHIQEKAKSNKPFFTYVGFTHFHPPFTVHEDFKNKSKSGIYADTQMEVDYNIGLILEAIKKAGIEENTLVILSGDNGAGNFPQGSALAAGEIGGGGNNGPWRGGLSTAYEGGLRTPAMIRFPGQIEAGRVSDEIVGDIDMYTTIASFAGAEKLVPSDRPIDGVDQKAFFLGKEQSNRDHFIVFVGDELFAVKWRNFKMHFMATESTHSPVATKFTFPQVFDIKNDPKEAYELLGNEGYSHTWVFDPIMKKIGDLKGSMNKYRNIQPGEEFKGYD